MCRQFIMILEACLQLANNRCRCCCSVSYGGRYCFTAGCHRAHYNGNIQNNNDTQFWCQWDANDGRAVMMIDGGGPRANHGLGLTEDNYGMFNGGAKSDFGDNLSLNERS